PPVTAVDGLSLDVPRGAVVGFLGPNGAGKSSTLKVLMGFQKASAGTAHIFGHTAGSLAARRRIGFLPEVALYYPFLTPREGLALYGRVQGLGGASLRSEVNGLTTEVGLEGRGSEPLVSIFKEMGQLLGTEPVQLREGNLLF